MIIQSGLVFCAVSRGFGKAGKDVSDLDLVLWEKVRYVRHSGAFRGHVINLLVLKVVLLC
jgi:hypothetical protein